MTHDGDFLIQMKDMKTIGFVDPAGTLTEISGEPYLSILSMQGVSFLLNKNDLSLEITANPELLSKKIIDFSSRRQTNVIYPRDDSAFLNYRLDYNKDPSSAITWNVVNQVGVRIKDILFLSDASHTRNSEKADSVRLMSHFTYDQRNTLQRLVFGDFFASSGLLGSSVNIGGGWLFKGLSD